MKITPKVRKADNEHYYLFINVHDGGKYPERIPLKGHKIKQKDWNLKGNEDKKNWVKAVTGNNSRQINNEIYELLTKIKAEKLGLAPKDILEQRSKRMSGGKTPFLPFVEKIIDERRESATRSNDIYALQKLKQYLEIQDNLELFFKEITSQFVKDYYNWLLDNQSLGSANEYLNKLSAWYHMGLNDGSIGFKELQSPFKGLKKKRPQKQNKSLDKNELKLFMNVKLPESKPKYLNAYNMFMYQFWGAFRCKDVVLLKWSNIYKRDGELILDFFTSKGKIHIVRTLPLIVQRYFIPSIERNYPGFTEEVTPKMNQIKELHTRLEKAKEDNDKGNDLSATDVLKLINEGKTPQQITEILESHGTLIDNLTNQIETLTQDITDNFVEKFDELNFDRPTQYVFPYANKLKLPDMPWDEQSQDKYKSIVTDYNYYLNRLRILARIRTKISSHVSRHTASSRLMREGFNPHATSAFLTHKSLTTTEIYRGTLGLQDDEVSGYLSTLLE